MLDLDELADLCREARAERRFRHLLLRHPDPRDPDHPEPEGDEADDSTAETLDFVRNLLDEAEAAHRAGSDEQARVHLRTIIATLEEIAA